MAIRTPSPCLSIVLSPTAAEATALALAAAYLNRAGTHAASLLLDHVLTDHDDPLLEAVRDQLLSGAALCDGHLDVAGDAGGHAWMGRGR